MCEFISWIETKDKIYFLTKKQMDSPRGEALKLRFPGEGELIGHSAIRAYYEIDTGEEKECTDFSSPDNFHPEIVTAIKRGEFRGMATPKQLLTEQALAEYEKILQPAWDEYAKIRQPARAEYEKILQQAFWDLFEIPENRTELWRDN